MWRISSRHSKTARNDASSAFTCELPTESGCRPLQPHPSEGLYGRLFRWSPERRRHAGQPRLHERRSKHAFDVCYYPCLDATRGRPFGLYIHGNEGTEGAERGVTAITTGLAWVKAAEHVVVSGKPSKADLEACWELGATVAARLMG